MSHLEEKIREGKKVTDYLPNMGFQGDPLNLQHVQVTDDVIIMTHHDVIMTNVLF